MDCINAVMSETAYRNAVDYIVTRNERDYSRSKIPVVSPDDFLRMLSDSAKESPAADNESE